MNKRFFQQRYCDKMSNGICLIRVAGDASFVRCAVLYESIKALISPRVVYMLTKSATKYPVQFDTEATRDAAVIPDFLHLDVAHV